MSTEAGVLLRAVQNGERLSMPQSRPMTTIGARVHELRVPDGDLTWRVVYRVDPDAIVIADVFAKKTSKTPKAVLNTCRTRYARYDANARG